MFYIRDKCIRKEKHQRDVVEVFLNVQFIRGSTSIQLTLHCISENLNSRVVFRVKNNLI